MMRQAAGSVVFGSVELEHLESPALGIETTKPRFSWTFSATDDEPRGLVQTSYQITLATSEDILDTGPWVWNSGAIITNHSSLLEYSGNESLLPACVYFWRVTCMVVSSPFKTKRVASPAQRFSILPTSWSGHFIGMDSLPAPFLKPCPWFRKSFLSGVSVSHALMYVGSIGYHELYINGQKVSDDVLAPSVSDLGKRVLIRTYNITGFLNTGKMNTIGLWLAPGWASFDSVNPKKANMFNTSKAPMVLAELQLLSVSHHTAAASQMVVREVVSDATWQCSESDTSHIGLWTNSNFGGDRIDARKSIPENGWATPEYDKQVFVHNFQREIEKHTS